MDARPPRLPRRRLLPLLAALAALVPALARREAAAWRGWCRADPVVEVDGQTAHVWVAARARTWAEARRRVAGPPRLVLRVPPGVAARYVAGDRSFGYEFEVAVEEAAELAATADRVPVAVAAYVPTEDGQDEALPIRVAFAPAGWGWADAGGEPAAAGEASPLAPGGGTEPPGGEAARGRLRPGEAEGRSNAWVRLRAPAAADDRP